MKTQEGSVTPPESPEQLSNRPGRIPWLLAECLSSANSCSPCSVCCVTSGCLPRKGSVLSSSSLEHKSALTSGFSPGPFSVPCCIPTPLAPHFSWCDVFARVLPFSLTFWISHTLLQWACIISITKGGEVPKTNFSTINFNLQFHKWSTETWREHVQGGELQWEWLSPDLLAPVPVALPLAPCLSESGQAF